MSRLPVIGICAALEPARWSFWDQPAAIVAQTYIEKVVAAGGVPIGLIAHARMAKSTDQLIDLVDGILLIGGVDMEPETYGAEKQPETERTAPVRDQFELALAAAALQVDLPVLGICRGMHVLNVAAGGTLSQHLLGDGYGEHRPDPGRLGASTRHEVVVSEDTLAAAAVGDGLRRVNSHHHQGVDLVAPQAVVTTRSAGDDLPEAIEWPSCRHAIGVQWHPEELGGDEAIAEFVHAASGAVAKAGARG